LPELPEMQALAERLEAFLGRSTLSAYEPHQFSALKTVSPPPEELIGRTVERIDRRGKYVLLDFGGPRLAFHLSQGGRVDVEEPAKRTRPKGAVVRFRFEGDKAVLIKEFGTERKAGWWVLPPGEEGPLDKLGPEPDSEEFATLIREGSDNRRVHTMLRDQRTVAGLGRGYTDDALHEARLSPYASLKSLDRAERERLFEAIDKVLTDGLETERKRAGGLPTKVGDHWVVHKRSGHPCPRCGADLRRVSYESHEVTYCPACQTGGKILADRRMSRLIR
jgi:formamidopyrimidine-DNA glycosylase